MLKVYNEYTKSSFAMGDDDDDTDDALRNELLCVIPAALWAWWQHITSIAGQHFTYFTDN